MMRRCRVLRSIVPLVLIGLVCAGRVGAGVPAAKKQVIIPDRRRVVTLLQDVYRLRDFTLIACRGTADSTDPLLHTWNGADWVEISLQQLRDEQPVDSVIVIAGNMLPASVVDVVSASADLRHYQTVDSATLLTELSALMGFSSRELKWLAKEQGLKLRDANAERRKYGRYGKPGEQREVLQPRKPSPEYGPVPMEPSLRPIDDEDLPEKGAVKKGMAEKGMAEKGAVKPVAAGRGMDMSLPPPEQPR